MLEKEAMKKLFREVKPDPVTGQLNDTDIIQYINAHPNDPMRGAIWLVSLDYFGLTTEERWGDNWDTGDQETTHGKKRAEERGGAPGQSFQLTCKIREGPEVLGIGDDDVRKVSVFLGLPTWNEIEEFTFFNQFKPPFTWIFETDQIRDNIGEKDLKRANESFRKYMKYSEDLKERGNKAFAGGRREEAVAKFQDAAENLDKLLLKKISEPHEKEAQTRLLLAICLSNCSAAIMLVVDGQKDVDGSIKDAERAIIADATCPKSYNRLSRAYEEQGNIFEAQRALARGLCVKKLENHYGLADHFILLRTQEKGLKAMGKEEYESWWNLTFVEDKRMADLMDGLEGSWKKRLEDRRAEF
ncbi:hypothetical protein CPB83DRAFT_835841 [Crepidotus variabilis]|uniref:Tetratricopeptide repeat protein n=1 Tax=Crepidotus variabilis TaxID=179855 RepID=A0A9P6JQ50_9AGAR|nr:hypothetical protein CPB83DRAFT_835841 [Crepidotus variabilis]